MSAQLLPIFLGRIISARATRKAQTSRIVHRDTGSVGSDTMGKNLHSKPFDEGTKLKLALYKEYLDEWIPVFVVQPKHAYLTINIFDLFCGPGMDCTGEPGSPMIAIAALSTYFTSAIERKITFNLYFNEYSKSKLNQLKQLLSEQKLDKTPVKIHYSSEEFQSAFKRLLPEMSRSNAANFLFLDQNGIKEITDEVFKTIIKLPATDFLFFISSSVFNRFREHPALMKYIAIPETTISASKHLHIHRVLLDHYRELVPQNKEYYLAPFTIKKGANIYGLIFGSGNVLGIEKFLKRCWKNDPQRGEANFDIDEDGIHPLQPSIFPELDIPKKLKLFSDDLSRKILSRELTTNKQIYTYSLSSGFLPSHAREVVKSMLGSKKLPKQMLSISYDSCKKGKPEQTIIYE